MDLPPGNVEWQDRNRSRCLVMWRSPQEWGQLIFQWVGRFDGMYHLAGTIILHCPMSCHLSVGREIIMMWCIIWSESYQAWSYCTVLWRVCQNGSKQQQKMAELDKACLSRQISMLVQEWIGMVCRSLAVLLYCFQHCSTQWHNYSPSLSVRADPHHEGCSEQCIMCDCWFQQAQTSGLGTSVCTLYEIHTGEDSSEEG